MKTKLIPFGILTVGLFLAGCASTGKVMTAEEFDRLPPEKQEVVLTELEEKPERLERFREAQLRAGEPVKFEFSGIGYKMQCIKYPGSEFAELVTYHGQDAPSLSRAAHQALAVVAANPDCSVRLREASDGTMLPVTMRNDAGMSEGFFRALALRTVPAIMNGTGAVALRDALGNECNGGNCGSTFNVLGGMAQAVSGSESNSESNANSNTAIGGDCGETACGSVFGGIPPAQDNSE